MGLARAIGAALVGALAASSAAEQASEERTAERLEMVEQQIVARGVRDEATLRAMRIVPRHEFVAPSLAAAAYRDHSLPIGLGQSISQPYIVAYETELIQPREGLKVLEVGTGSGYQAAVLSAAGCAVYSIEIFEELASSARRRLERLGFRGISVRHGDGSFGWPEQAPFDAILVTAAATYVPPSLVEQLKPGGRMLIPVGSMYGAQNLLQVDKDSSGKVRTRILLPVAFVPMLSGLH